MQYKTASVCKRHDDESHEFIFNAHLTTTTISHYRLNLQSTILIHYMLSPCHIFSHTIPAIPPQGPGKQLATELHLDLGCNLFRLYFSIWSSALFEFDFLVS
jgi:hypothetical protein